MQAAFHPTNMFVNNHERNLATTCLVFTPGIYYKELNIMKCKSMAHQPGTIMIQFDIRKQIVYAQGANFLFVTF